MASNHSLHFHKMSGAGNDFVAFDNRDGHLPAESARREWFRRLCARGEGVGADGVLLIERAPGVDVRMRYYNADGGESMCGNGLRCVALLSHLLGAGGATMSIRSHAGLHRAEVLQGGRVSVTMPDPTKIRAGLELVDEGKTLRATEVYPGVPHTAFDSAQWQVPLAEIDVDTMGRRLRYHPALMPEGTNPNFYHRDANGVVHVRTYERGVEAETLACGTGSISCAIAVSLAHGQASPIEIRTRSGHTLVIHFRRDGDRFTDIVMEGPATVVFEGDLAAPMFP